MVVGVVVAAVVVIAMMSPDKEGSWPRTPGVGQSFIICAFPTIKEVTKWADRLTNGQINGETNPLIEMCGRI